MRTDWVTLAFCAVISFTVSLSVSLLLKQDDPILTTRSAWEKSPAIIIDTPSKQNEAPHLPPHLSGGAINGAEPEYHESRDDCVRRLLIGASYDKSGWLTNNMANVVRQQCQP